MLRSYLTIVFLLLSFVFVDVFTIASAQANRAEKISDTTQKILKRGSKLSMKGKSEKATRLYEKALISDSLNELDQASLKKKLISSYILTGRGLDAIELAVDVNFDKNRDSKILQNLLSEAIANERHATALNWMETYGTGYKKNSYHDYRTRSVVYGLMGRTGDVTQTIQKYAEKRPNDVLVKDLYMASLETLNREATRVASGVYPIMPSDAKRSGHCTFTIDVTASGKVSEVTEVNCTEDIFQVPSLKVVKAYIYLPKLVNGIAVSSIDDDVKVIYKLMGANGNLVPELRP